MIQLRPSSSYIWSGDTPCNAMPRFAEGMPPEPASDPAREGTCAAWIAEMVLTGEVDRATDLIGKTHENGWLITEDMCHIIQEYVNHMVERGGAIHTERKVRLNGMIAGTPDAYAVFADNGTLYVDDLKYGYEIVDPYRNTQVSIYAGAILRGLPAHVQVKKVVIGIYQPRAYHPQGHYRTWHVWPDQLMEFVRKIEQDGQDAQASDSKATPGFHCEHCPVASQCVALTHSVYKGFRVLTDNQKGQMSADQIVDEMRFLDMVEKLLKARKSAVKAEVIARKRHGEFIPGVGFEETYGNRKFTAPPEVVKALTGIDPYVEPKPCTPAELVRRRGDRDKKMIEGIVDRMSSKPRLEPKLVLLEKDHFTKLFSQKDDNA